jgi:3-hydroxybutyryl-CoA dehydrogenase
VSARATIACLGAGRMGRGIAVVFAYAGHAVKVVDFKPRPRDAFDGLAKEAHAEIRQTLAALARVGLFAEDAIDAIAARVSVVPEREAGAALRSAAVIFEGVPEVLELKREALARASALAGPDPIIASTTSTILVDDLSGAVERPERFLNAHWLNPAYLVPLVELSPGARTAPAVLETLKGLLEGIGKVPVVCAARPGYIVPRIQALAMNEAARMVEEGVASAAEIDKAIKYGFGFRFAVLGLLEFIDWGGGDILYYASRYLTQALGDPRYAAPPIVERNMKEGRIGLKSGHGFLDYETLDLDAYRLERLKGFVEMLRLLDLARPPAPDGK